MWLENSDMNRHVQGEMKVDWLDKNMANGWEKVLVHGGWDGSYRAKGIAHC